MIKSEDVRLLISRPRYAYANKNARNYMLRYITQQDKVIELLKLYRKRETNRKLPHPSQADEFVYTREINKLEEELK